LIHGFRAESGVNEGKRIGLLGGSFNPAHRGHLHISLAALDRLGLDQVWWLVSPQNPLKPASGMASYEVRSAAAEAHADDPRITVSHFEREHGTRYTADTLRALKSAHPDKSFVFLIGADNLIQFHKWRQWRRIFRLIPIAVFPRPSYSMRALSSRAARRFERKRVPESHAKRLVERQAPAWMFLHVAPDASSATKIRAKLT
jgi:nicotinate-nucleotide adenylyltransferase